jgi:predicted N-acetyltransferase YhbS
VDQEFSIAALTDGGVPAVVDLCREALDLPEDAAEADVIVARLRDLRPVPGATVADRRTLGLIAVSGAAAVGVALGSIAHEDPSIGHIDLIAVHPGLRQRGIGRALVGRAEDALAGLGAGEVRLAGNPPYYAWPGIDVRYTPAVCTATALGYVREDVAWNMTADLSYGSSPALRPTDRAEGRLVGLGVTVRRARPEDSAALVAFARVNFGPAWGGEVAHSLGREGAGCHVAVRDGKVLGFAAYGSSRPTWFGPMGTAQAARGLGIGGVLLRRCLRDQRTAGHEQAQIGWVGPVRFYADNGGARIERVFALYRKQLQ